MRRTVVPGPDSELARAKCGICRRKNQPKQAVLVERLPGRRVGQRLRSYHRSCLIAWATVAPEGATPGPLEASEIRSEFEAVRAEIEAAAQAVLA